MWQLLKILNIFNTLTLKQVFWKTRTFFKKLECEFLVESTKTENATFTYKTALSYPTVETNRMVRTKWAKRKERIFVSVNFECLGQFEFSYSKKLKTMQTTKQIYIKTLTKMSDKYEEN